MRIDEKSEAIEVLLCCAQDPDEVLQWNRTTWEVCRYWLESDQSTERRAGKAWRASDRPTASHGDVCLEAAYRLIESSPTLRREWFGR